MMRHGGKKKMQGSGHRPEAEAQILERIAGQYRDPHFGLDSLRRLHMPTHDNNVTELLLLAKHVHSHHRCDHGHNVFVHRNLQIFGVPKD